MDRLALNSNLAKCANDYMKHEGLLSLRFYSILVKLPLMEEFVYVDNEKYCWHDSLLNFLISRNIINFFDPEMSLELLYDLHFYPKMHCDESI